ncbi:hypothetical protein EV182_008132, partial [Spiromyces aspiralis]
MNRTAFFTRNGIYLGTAFRNLDTALPLYPTIGMRTQREKVTTNFGQKPFKFDIDLYVREQQELVNAQIAKFPLDSVFRKARADCGSDVNGSGSSSRYHSLVLGKLPSPITGKPREPNVEDSILEVVTCYLMHHGYYGTAKALVTNALGFSEKDSIGEEQQMCLQSCLDELSAQDRQTQIRRLICGHVRRGEIDAALELTQQHYPQ